jgi:hypothetical protein
MRGFICAAVAVIVAGGVAAQPAPEVQINVEPQVVTVGDVFEVTVTVAVPEDHEAVVPGEDANLGEVEVRGAERSTEKLADGGRRLTVVYEAAAWQVGEVTVSSPVIAVRGQDGEAEQLESVETTLTVESVLPAGAEDIHDIRGPKEIPLKWYHYAIAALPVLGLLALIALVVWWVRSRRAGEEPEPAPKPQLPPAEEALEALRALQDEDLPARGRVEEHYVQVSYILRRYLERRWNLPALEETTGMLRRTMLGSGRVPDEAAERITEVLQRADLAKFAKHRPQANIAMADLVQVRDIVYTTRPPREVAEGAPGDEPVASPAS